MRTESSRTLLQAVRADPHHASELVLLRVLAQLAPNVTARHKVGVPVEQATKRLIRRATSLARRDGAITGSSFYVGMPSAMAMIYCHQLLLVVRIAAQLGSAAVAYYAAHPEPPAPDPEVVLPPRPGPRARILLTCAVIAAGVILGVAAAMIPLGTTHLEVPRWVGIVLMELFLAVTFSRLLWITRQPSTTRPA